MPELVNQFKETKLRGLLFDWTKLDGWEAKAESMSLFTRTELRLKLERVAILADMTWNSEIADLQEVSRLPIRRFAPLDRQSAVDWLNSAS